MKGTDFVFSNERRFSLLRHTVFWAAWGVYFYVTFWYNQQSLGYSPDACTNLGSHIFLKFLVSMALLAAASYFFIYFLLPRYVINLQWLKLLAGIITLGIFVFIAGYVQYKWIFPILDFILGAAPDSSQMSVLWKSASMSLLNTPKIVAAAAIVKLGKYWWVKQKEKEKLEREKISTELELLKAQINPGFLFNTLNNIYAYSLAGSLRASEMVLKLSDLLSYMLYECDRQWVPLENEVEMMKEYISLEKIRRCENLEMEISVKGNLTGKKIAPFLLLPYIEDSFKHAGSVTQHCWIHMEIKAEGEMFYLKLISGTSEDNAEQPALQSDGLANVKKRLTLLYPEKHELKVTSEGEMYMLLLKIRLGDGDVTNDVSKEQNQTSMHAEQ